MNITQRKLKEILSYDELAGKFFWRKAPNIKFKDGDEAGSRHKRAGYIYIGIERKYFAAHRLAWLYVYGEWPKQFIDHINGIRDDNRIENLRDVSRAINNQNKRSAPKHSASGLLGAFKDKKRWASHIHVGGKIKHLGMFDTPEEAHAAFVAAKRKFHPGCTL